MTLNDEINLIKLELKAKEDALKLFPEVIETVKNYNGKVFNKRLNDTLSSVNPLLRCRIDHGFSFVISMWIDEYSVPSEDGKGCYNSILSRELYLCSLSKDQALTEKRINANAIVATLEERKWGLEKEIKNLREGIEKIPLWISLHKKVIEAVKAFRDQIPSEIKEYCSEFDLQKLRNIR